jgi:hypothetical protein
MVHAQFLLRAAPLPTTMEEIRRARRKRRRSK